jgi:hypothetical protein
MNETLTIRIRAEEKVQWEKAAAEVRETVAEYVRKAVRQRMQSGGISRWESTWGQLMWPGSRPPMPIPGALLRSVKPQVCKVADW